MYFSDFVGRLLDSLEVEKRIEALAGIKSYPSSWVRGKLNLGVKQLGQIMAPASG